MPLNTESVAFPICVACSPQPVFGSQARPTRGFRSPISGRSAPNSPHVLLSDFSEHFSLTGALRCNPYCPLSMDEKREIELGENSVLPQACTRVITVKRTLRKSGTQKNSPNSARERNQVQEDCETASIHSTLGLDESIARVVCAGGFARTYFRFGVSA